MSTRFHKSPRRTMRRMQDSIELNGVWIQPGAFPLVDSTRNSLGTSAWSQSLDRSIRHILGVDPSRGEWVGRSHLHGADGARRIFLHRQRQRHLVEVVTPLVIFVLAV